MIVCPRLSLWTALALVTCFQMAFPVGNLTAAAALDGFEGLFADEVLAEGKDVTVTRNELDRAFIYIKANKAAQGLQIRASQRMEVEKQLLEKLITTRLIINRARPSEIKDGDAFKEQQLTALREQLGSQQALDRHIVASGLTEAYFHQQLVEEGIVKAVVEREVKGNYLVPESEIRQTYQDNQAAFTIPESVRIRRIFMARISQATGNLLPQEALKEKESLMAEIRSRALKGDDFAALAKAYSEDAMTRPNGGEIVILKGQTKPDFEIPVFRLRAGTVSPVMTIGAGLHLVKMLEHRPAKLRPLKEVEPIIRRRAEATFVEQRLPDYLEKLKREARVKYVNEL